MMKLRIGCGGVKMTAPSGFWTGAAVAAFLLAALVSCQDINNEETIDNTRIKRENVPENRDLTVLLVNDQKRSEYNTKVGRYHSVKPLIGLLTSTARTFIQDGVTTEFATQILGTTLDNGRIYAQLLTKSSLVLYNKPSNVEDAPVQPTRVHSAFDGEWNVKQDLGFIDPEKFILKNTDYLAPSKMEIVYASKPALDNLKYWSPPTSSDNQDNQILEEPTGRRVQQFNEIPRYVQHEAINYLDGPSIENEKKLELIQPSILESVNTLHRQSKAHEIVTEPITVNSRVNEDMLNESKVVKVKPNYDLPTFTIKNEFSPIFYYIDNVESRISQPQVGQQTKLPKKMFGQKSEPRPKKTFTYAGFADFTTVVGDTVIIFTPNTDTVQPPKLDEVNVFPSAKRVDKLATKITFLSAEIPVATSTYKAYEVNAATKLTTPSGEENRSEKALYNDDDNLKKVLYEVDKMPDSVSVQYNNEFDLNLDVIQPSEPAMTTPENAQTDNLEVLPIQDYNSKATEPLSVIRPSSTIIRDSKESVVTDSDIIDMLTNSEEEDQNTAAEVTDKDEEQETTTEMEPDIMTTTESGHSDESFEDLETTTETKNETSDEECTDLLTLSTMTTAYKTLTYLTTYFIPLESSDTTTSVKSDVVIESNVGYLSNVVCKTNFDIEPTAVISVETKSSVQSSLESPEISSDEEIKKLEVVTENIQLTTQPENNSTPKPEQKAVTENEVFDESDENVDQKESTTSTTTTERVEVSVSTEHSTTPTEKPTSQEVEDEENQIDLIYKTLFTTYTYFTTFFGDQTSSVASHKSVVTNILTSTIDLSKLDPSLLGAFNEDEIAPTNVGIGRPTETFAINSIIDLVKNKDVLESVEVDEKYSSQTPTPTLGDDVIASIKPDAVKTYYTTYTFFTTIYVGSDANVCSRSEVYTNYVGPDELIPTKTNPLAAETTRAQFDFRNCKQVKREPPKNPEENSSIETSVSMEENKDQITEDTNKKSAPQPSPLEVDMLFSVESNPLESENSYVTDVKSSSSKGERKYIENNNVLDDQISSESNIDEIMPSPTLLLQTSYTTFTYFTTMYIGKDSSKVKSRLETITNVVTETIMPKKEIEEESNLPITYYTTFTYWTTLYKDKATTITSREEIVSNVVTPSVQIVPTVSPIDTTPIDIDSVLPPKDLEVELKPSLIDDSLEHDDGKATFYTTYTYFTTFYAGNTSQIRSSLETVTNIVDNTKIVEDNQLGRKVQTGADKNLVQDEKGEKLIISPTVVKQEIIPTKLPDVSAGSPTVILGTYIDNLFAEVKSDNNTKSESDKKILFSQVAVISGDSTVVTSDNKTLSSETTTTSGSTVSSDGSTLISPAPDVIQSSVREPETTTEAKQESEDDDDGSSSRKPGRLTYTSKKPSVIPVIRPFASRNRPTFSPKRVPLASGATTITRADFTPTITATPTLKTVRASGFGGNRKGSVLPGAPSSGRRFSGRSSASSPAGNIPSASRAGFGRGSIQPTSRRTGFGSSAIRGSSLNFASRSALPRIRPTASLKLRGGRQSASVSLPPPDQNESETSETQHEENATEPIDEVTEATVKTTNNPLQRFRRPLLGRQPGTQITPRSTTPATRRTAATRGRLTTTTRRTTTRSTTNPLLSLRRQRPPNALFPRRNLFKQSDPEPEEEIKEEEQKVDESEEILDEEEETDNDYESSDRKEQQVTTPSTPAPVKNPNTVRIRPFAFRRRTKRQADYGTRKYANFRRPGSRSTTRRPESEPETEPPVPVTQKARARFSSRISGSSRATTAASPNSSPRQPFIIRGESRTTTTATPAYKRGKTRTSSRATTASSRPKTPRLLNKSSSSRSSPRGSSRSRTRTTTSRASSRQRGSHENFSGERFNNYNHIVNDGKITVTHHIPTEVTIPVVNGKITEYKSVISATPRVETLLQNQVTTTIGPLGSPQIVLVSEATEIGENGATKLVKFVLRETPTTSVIFTPTTIRGRKTSYSHIVPSTVYNVEPVTQTIAPEISANVPLANLLLSQLLLGNQQPAVNPLLALQGQGLFPQQPVAQTPVTEYKTRTTTYVTTVTDARETVLTITFRATPIETTIRDPTVNVITATEYITETVVTTPTVLGGAPQQFNSLLLPLLLQQQQQQQQQAALQTANPLLGLGQPDLTLLQGNNLNNDIYSNSPKPNILSDLISNEDFEDSPDDNEDLPSPPSPPSRIKNKPKPPKPAPPKHTSVVTLYVSGRHPGEFSTVLSTVVTDDTQVVRKREAIFYEDVKIAPSILPTIDELVGSQGENTLENSVTPDISRYFDEKADEDNSGTQSLESIVGEISEHIRYDASPTFVVKLANPSSIVRDTKQSSVDARARYRTNAFSKGFNTNAIVYDNTPWRPGRVMDIEDRPVSEEDERKLKNLATRIMSNGVEVLVKDKSGDSNLEQTKFMELKTIQPSVTNNLHKSNLPKIHKRVDDDVDETDFDLIQPSESGHTHCTTSCSCSHTKTENLKTRYNYDHSMSAASKYGVKTSKYGNSKQDVKPTKIESFDKSTQYGPYEHENSQLAPTDRIVEKYTEVINDYSDEKDSNSVEASELLTNEQAPAPPKTNKVTSSKVTERPKPGKPQKPNKNKVLMADLLKLGSLGIKGLSQLAPVFEKMTGGLIKKQENNKTSTASSTATVKPVKNLTPYNNVDKRIDEEMESKHYNFPIYIPVDELDTSESQIVFTNATLHQNLAWTAEQKQPKAHIHPPKMVHESPLVNGGIPISPGEIITANSDVIVGKPAVGGPLTLAASGMKLHNPVNPPPIDSFVSGSEQYFMQEKPGVIEQSLLHTKVDDSYDLRPPEISKSKPNRNIPRPSVQYNYQNSQPHNKHHFIHPVPLHPPIEHMMKTEQMKTNILGNHGRPAYLDYIPSLAKPNNHPLKSHVDFKPVHEEVKDDQLPDNNPSSSEVFNTRVTVDGKLVSSNTGSSSKPFLVDIQPSKVANVLIPHGSATALVFAGSSEPHKTGDYVDDPLPYPEPGYFGSFSIDAPQMTNVHNVAPNENKHFMAQSNQKTSPESYEPNNPSTHMDQTHRNELKPQYTFKRPIDFSKLPPPTSNQETYVQVGPKVTSFNPDVYRHNNGEFEKYNHVRGSNRHKDGKDMIDKEYENYLAVPPPPPPHMQRHNHPPIHKDSHFDNKNKPYNQKPIVHVKPVQDMKVFLNIQHPVPDSAQTPPKVTSEIYFASQAPNSKPSATYTIQMPPSSPINENIYTTAPNSQHYNVQNTNSGQFSNSFSVVASPNFANQSLFANSINDKDNTYTVTLNTATNVASNVGDADSGQVIGSSIPVPVGNNNNQLNTDIPIGTNLAIKVDDGMSPFENYHLQSNKNPPVAYNDQGIASNKVSTQDNRWNKSTIIQYGRPIIETTVIGNNYSKQNQLDRPVSNNSPIQASLNSHANFPMINEPEKSPNITNVKSETEKGDIKILDQKRPAKVILNTPTNSHGWYSSGFLNENTLNNIKVEVTTRKVIPLSHEYNNGSIPDFGIKITSVGKPPSGIWQETSINQNKNNIGKPFSTPHVTENPITKHQSNYVISMLEDKQPAYDIPIRDNSDETTTNNIINTTKKVKTVYEDSEQVYDGKEEIETSDGEFSEESMKIPVITTSHEEQLSSNLSKNTKDHSVDSTQDPYKQNNVQLVEFNPGTQTEKPFNTSIKQIIQSNTIRPIYSSLKPSPFVVNSPTLDHQLHQPHWQINQLMVNSTNVSYEESLDLNIGEEMGSSSSTKPSTPKPFKRYHDYEIKYKRPQRPTFAVAHNNSRIVNSSNIITSTVQINDKKPLIVEDTSEMTKSTPISLTTVEIKPPSSEIIDLSPPPPTLEYSFKPSTNDEMIMGMSPPPPKTQSPMRHPPRNPPTPRPMLPTRTPPPYRTLPPRTLLPKKPTTSRPFRRPLNRDEVSTYRPTYDILNNAHRPSFNRDQPSSHLLPPPRVVSSEVATPLNELSSPTVHIPIIPNIVFPTPTSSGWLTSSGIGFSSSFDFGPSSVQFPDISESSIVSLPEVSSTENSYSHDGSFSSEHREDTSSEKVVSDKAVLISSTESITNVTSSSEEINVSDSEANESSHEDNTTERMKVIPIPPKSRTRKPYPIRSEEKKSSTNKYKPPRPTTIIRPTKTLSRPEIIYPTRQSSTRKVLKPSNTKPTTVTATVIESSENSLEEDFIQPTEVLKENELPSLQTDSESTIKNVIKNTIIQSLEEVKPTIQTTHHAGNEIKIVDDITPTKTEFRTTVVTLTKTLSEPPKTVSSIGYVNLTHTLTVTHTKTSLVSQSEGAVTQTLVLTNTHTSTIVDVVTEIHTQVQPTTIIETVTKHIPVPNVEATPVQGTPAKTKIPLDHISMSSEEENFIITDNETTEIIQKVEPESEGDTFFVVMNKSQNGGKSPPISTDSDTGGYDITRNEQVNNNGVSQVLFGEILLAGTPYLETTNVVNPTGAGFGKECEPDCKASRNERCQRIDGMMKCVCRPGFARMFPDRPCKPTYTYSVKLALGSHGEERLIFNESLADNSSKQYHSLAMATHEGINRMVMQSDLRDVYHGIHITGFSPVEVKGNHGELYQGVMNDFYVQLSDNAHESRLKEVIEKYLRNNNYSLGGTDVHAASELVDRLDVSDFNECTSGQFHDCSEHAQCFNLRGTYTCSCLEGYADLSVNSLYPGRICSAEPVGCERCNYHGTCYSRDDRRVLCECFQWYAGSSCHINLKVVLISLVVLGALLTVVLAVCAIVACRRPRPPPRSIVTCIQGMPSLHQGAIPSKQRADRRALISDRGDSGDASSIQNASLPYMPAKRPPASSKKCTISDPPAHDPPPPPPSVMIPRARLHPHHSDSRENISRKKSLELTSPSEAKLISYLESGVSNNNEEMRRKHSMESSYSANKDRHNKQGNRNGKGALVSAGFKVSTTVRTDEVCRKDDRDDMSSINKNDLEAELRFDSLRKSYSQEELSEWTDAERRIGELTLSEARSIGGTLPASTGRAASSTRLTHQEANTMAERDLGSTFLLPHVHLYKPDLTSDVSEFDSL